MKQPTQSIDTQFRDFVSKIRSRILLVEMIYVTVANYSENKVLWESLFHVSHLNTDYFNFFQNSDEFFSPLS